MKITYFFIALSPILFGLACSTTHKKQTMNNSKNDTTTKNVGLTDTIQQIGCPEAKTMTLKNGQVFILKLKAYPSKGYSWTLDVNPETLKTIAFKGRTIEEPNSDTMDGAPAYNIFTFTGIQAGEETLKFRYARPFDNADVKPLETCVLTLVVQ
jgi:predicted secreted protein